jgi:class 3 adenylate cyclase/ligand-binding sensor domain-containing protein/predicted metal-dependent HD superfamily phosphohydrolase
VDNLGRLHRQNSCKQRRKGKLNLLFYCFTLSQLFLFSHSLAQTQYVRFHYLGTEEGLTQAYVTALSQDPSGFIWIGTQDGLNRYDGYHIKTYKNNPNDTFSLPSNSITGLHATNNHYLWIAHERGISQLDLKTNRCSRATFPGAEKAVQQLSGNADWISFLSSSKHLVLVDSKSPRNHYAEYEFRDSIVQQEWCGNRLKLLDTKGHIFTILPEKKELKQSDVTEFLPKEKPKRISLLGEMIVFMYEKHLEIRKKNGKILRTIQNASTSANTKFEYSISPDTSIWLGNPFEISKIELKSGKVSLLKSAPGSLFSPDVNRIHCMYKDMTGSIWFGTENGLAFADPRNLAFRFVPVNELGSSGNSSIITWCIARQLENNFLGTSEGLFVFDNQWQSMQKIILARNSKQNPSVYSLAKKGNCIYAGTDHGMYMIKEQKKKFVIADFNLDNKSLYEGNRIYQIQFYDSTIWLATQKGVVKITENNQQHQVYETNRPVRQLLITSKQRIFLATDGNGLMELNWKENGKPAFLTHKEGLTQSMRKSTEVVLTLYQLGDKLYAGTFGGGLLVFDTKQNRFTQFYTEADGLANNSVNAILPGGKDSLWLSTNNGLNVFIPSAKKFKNYEKQDGLLCSEFNAGAGSSLPGGELFFGAVGGLVVFHPSHLRKNEIPPLINITGVKLLNKYVGLSHQKKIFDEFPYTDTLNFNFRERYFTVDLSASHYSNPGKNRFRYRLLDRDEEWIDLEQENKISFNNLEPGDYLLEAEAYNPDGIISQNKARLFIHIQAPFWKTIWAKILSGLILIAMTIGYNRRRVLAVVKQKRILEQLVEERTEKILHQTEEINRQKDELEIEKNKSDKLLLNMLPSDTAEELKTKGRASARSYRQASVMFTDFVGFTAMSQYMRPRDLVFELDECFRTMDEIVEQYGLEKIKTIGDSYMCVGGVPVRNISNPFDSLLAALAIMDYIRKRNYKRVQEGKMPWKLRVGIHTGELVAGVIGSRRLAYDVWGATVNVAKRMEAAAEPGTINISHATYQLVSDFFDCIPRGRIEAKNIGPTTMYFVDGLKEEFRHDNSLFVPNELYNERLNHLLYSRFNYKKMEQHMIKLLSENLPPEYRYHSLKHTLDVRDMAEKIGKSEGLGKEEIFLLKTAALYHDAGFLIRYENNEEAGAELAEKHLPSFGYSAYQIGIIKRLILATKMNVIVQDLMEMIICDADLDYLGRDDFPLISDFLRQELIHVGKIKTNKEWDELQIKFLTSHMYYTSSSKKTRDSKKQSNLNLVKKRFENYR